MFGAGVEVLDRSLYSTQHRAISTDLFKRTGFTVASGEKTGAVTLIQRFGSALNLTRFHGVFAPNCKHRKSVVPKRKPGEEQPDKPSFPLPGRSD